MLIIPCCINIKSLFSSGQVIEMTSPEENSELCFPETTSMAKPRGTLKVEGKQNSMFPEGLLIKFFVIPPDSKLEDNCEKRFVKHYCGCACSTSGSQTELSYRNDSITVFFFSEV